MVHHILGEPEDRVQRLLKQLELPNLHLTDVQRTRLVERLQSYSDVLTLDPSELGVTSVVQHSIDTGDHRPIRQPVRRLPFALWPQVDKLVQERLTEGVIQPSSSPWASPVVLVRKKDGTMRFCVYYRRLNSVTKLDEFPLPRIDDTLDVLAGAKYFTTLDMVSGCYGACAMREDCFHHLFWTRRVSVHAFRSGKCTSNLPETYGACAQWSRPQLLSGVPRRCIGHGINTGGA